LIYYFAELSPTPLASLALIDAGIAEGDPLTPKDWNEEKEHQMLERRELVRQRCVKAFSSSPLYQAAAAKNPKYWDDFSVGRI
jgi:hypothetical protein